MNKSILTGHLTKDLQMSETTAGLAIAKTSIACSRVFTQNGEKKEEVMFVDLTFWGKTALNAQIFFSKGSHLLIEGRLDFDSWVGQNGEKKSKHSITVETFEPLDPKKSTEAQPAAQQ